MSPELKLVEIPEKYQRTDLIISMIIMPPYEVKGAWIVKSLNDHTIVYSIYYFHC